MRSISHLLVELTLDKVEIVQAPKPFCCSPDRFETPCTIALQLPYNFVLIEVVVCVHLHDSVGHLVIENFNHKGCDLSFDEVLHTK